MKSQMQRASLLLSALGFLSMAALVLSMLACAGNRKETIAGETPAQPAVEVSLDACKHFASCRVYLFDRFQFEAPLNWLVTNSDAGRIYFGVSSAKAIKKGVTEIAWVAAGDVADTGETDARQILEYIKIAKSKDLDGERLKLIKGSFQKTRMNQMDCLKFDHLFEDHGALDKNGQAKLMHVVGASCLLPGNVNHYIDLELSVRYPSDLAAPNIAAETKGFLESLAVAKIKGAN